MHPYRRVSAYRIASKKVLDFGRFYGFLLFFIGWSLCIFSKLPPHTNVRRNFYNAVIKILGFYIFWFLCNRRDK